MKSEEPVGVARLLRMKLDLVLVDPTHVEAGWRYVDGICRGAPELDLIVCSGRVSRERRVRGLRGGVADWITKPMDPVEIAARIDAVTRSRCAGRGPRRTMSFGELTIEPKYMQAQVAGRNLGLTRTELDLLATLAETRGRVLPREELYRRAWGHAMPPGDRSVDVFIARLRHKLEAGADRRYIHTHFGVGYRFDPTHFVDKQSPELLTST